MNTATVVWANTIPGVGTGASAKTGNPVAWAKLPDTSAVKIVPLAVAMLHCSTGRARAQSLAWSPAAARSGARPSRSNFPSR